MQFFVLQLLHQAGLFLFEEGVAVVGAVVETVSSIASGDVPMEKGKMYIKKILWGGSCSLKSKEKKVFEKW